MKSGSFEPDFFVPFISDGLLFFAIKLKYITYVLIIEKYLVGLGKLKA